MYPVTDYRQKICFSHCGNVVQLKYYNMTILLQIFTEVKEIKLLMMICLCNNFINLIEESLYSNPS